MEELLAWILGAEEKLNMEQKQKEEESSLDTIQQIFQSMDDFANESKSKGKAISDTLQEGQLLVKSFLSEPDDIKEIDIQRDLLADKWEELKNLIMDKQEQLHHTLMSLQKKHLNDFSTWLKTAEDQIASFSEIAADPELVKQQYREHMRFQNEVREHESMVKTLASMLVIIDECENPNISYENLTDELVDQLEALAEKWTNVCRIVDERETALRIWMLLLEQETSFGSWVAKTENRLAGIQAAVDEAMKSSSGAGYLSELLGRLNRMQGEEKAKRDEYLSMLKTAQVQLKKIDKDCQAAIRIKEKIDGLSKQWESVTGMRKLLSEKIQAMCDLQNQSKLERKGSIRANSLDSQRSSKRIKNEKDLDTWKRDDWNKLADVFVKSLRSHEQILGVNQASNQADNQSGRHEEAAELTKLDDLDLKEQEVLVEETQLEFGDKELDYQDLVQQGTILIEALKNLNRDATKDEERLETMKQRWGALKDALESKQQKLSAHQSLLRLQGECNVMKRVLNLSIARLDSERSLIKKLNARQNYAEINKIYEQFMLRTKSMLTQRLRVQAIRSELGEIVQQFPPLGKERTADDLRYFLENWEEMDKKSTVFQQEVEAIMKLGKRVKKREEKLSETYPKLVNAIDLLEQWLIKTYQIVYVGELNLFWTGDEYDEQLRSFRGLEKDINNEKENLDYINETGENVVQMHADAAWTPAFKSKVRNLNRKWNETIEILTNKIRHLDSLRELMPKLDRQIGEFETWSETAQKFLAGAIEFGDFEMMDKQIEQYDALVADIDGEVKKRIDIISEHYKVVEEIIKSSNITRFASSLSLNELPKADEQQQSANEAFKEELQQKVNEQIQSWNLIRDEAVSKRDVLIESLRECQKIDEKIDNFDKEIEKIKCDRLMLSDIDSLKEHCADLEAINHRLKRNWQSCTKMKENLEKLNSKGKFETKICLEKMIAKITAIEAKCSDLITEIGTICSNGKTIQAKYDELCKLYTSRAHWLDKLEMIISRSTQELVDSEEISDYIDNLENHLKNRPTDVSLDLVETIINDLNELFFDVTGYVDQQEERWQTITAEAGNRDKQLLAMLGETQELEQQLLIMQEKLNYIESSLGADEQLNVEHFEAKFKDASEMISFLEKQIDKILAEQRHIAAKRFKEQLRFLQIGYTELDRRFNELKSVPDVKQEKDTLIEELKKVYDNLASRQLTSSETDLIQAKLFEVTQPLPDLQNRIQELQRSAHSLDHHQFSGPLEDQTKQSSKASVLKSDLDLDLKDLLTDLQLAETQVGEDLKDPLNDPLNDPLANSPQSNGPTTNDPNYSDYLAYDGQRTPQAIEINLNLDNSEYLNEEELFEESVDEPWERCVTNNYVPYYKNHERMNVLCKQLTII